MDCPPAKADTIQVAERFRRGEHDAVYDLLGLYGKRLRGFIRVFVANEDLAEDLTQDVFVRAYAKRDTLTDPACLESWLFAIARNIALREAQRKVHFVEVQMDAEDIERLEVDGPAAAAKLQADETARVLHDLLAELDEKRRTLMALRYFTGLSHREIAETLQIPIGSVGTTIGRTLETMRKSLEARGLKAEDLFP